MGKATDKRRWETEERIINAACDLFSRQGYHNTQVMDIQKAAGMSSGTFYNYFKDKRDLYEHITIKSLESLRLKLRGLREPVDAWKPRVRSATLLASLNAIFDYIDSNPGRFILILRGGFGVDEDLDRSMWEYFLDFVQDVGEDLLRWKEDGIVEEGLNPVLFGTSVLGMIIQLIHAYLFEKKLTREQIIPNVANMMHTMFEAYLTEKGKKALALAREAGAL
jgi:AcrR family transcriptional regulator